MKLLDQLCNLLLCKYIIPYIFDWMYEILVFVPDLRSSIVSFKSQICFLKLLADDIPKFSEKNRFRYLFPAGNIDIRTIFLIVIKHSINVT